MPELRERPVSSQAALGWGGTGAGAPGQRLDSGPWSQTPVRCCFVRSDDCILHSLNCPYLQPNPQMWSGLDAWLIFKKKPAEAGYSGSVQSQNGHYEEEMIIAIN